MQFTEMPDPCFGVQVPVLCQHPSVGTHWAQSLVPQSQLVPCAAAATAFASAHPGCSHRRARYNKAVCLLTYPLTSCLNIPDVFGYFFIHLKDHSSPQCHEHPHELLETPPLLCCFLSLFLLTLSIFWLYLNNRSLAVNADRHQDF